MLFLIVLASTGTMFGMWDHPGYLPPARDQFVEEYIDAVKSVSDDLQTPQFSQTFLNGYRYFYDTNKDKIINRLHELNQTNPEKNYLMKNEIMRDEIETTLQIRNAKAKFQ